MGEEQQQVRGAGVGTTLVIVGVLLGVLGAAAQAWVYLVLAIPVIAAGAVAIARRADTPEKRLERAENFRWPYHPSLVAALAVGFWIWAISRGAVVLYLFAALWTVIAVARIWYFKANAGSPKGRD